MKVLTAICLALILGTLLVAIGYTVSLRVDAETFSFSFGLPAPLRIVHVSDLHAPYSFLPLSETASLILERSPDCIVLTGDSTDGTATKEEIEALSSFFSALSSSCPCFLTIGNHEIGSDYLDCFLQTAKNAGVTVLQNETKTVTIKGTTVAFLGLSDGYPYRKEIFSTLPTGKEDLRILLSHRPEKLSQYAEDDDFKPDLVFAGHAHGGIARLGKIALYAPNQGLFPHYTSGLYEENGTRMIVSRGLGVSGTDFRCFNPYHLPVAVLR